ncbi:hypothetical protein DFH29DRAFT_877129 [Suillus ampliporus]|nr:hypothetical protein DFH29DRAFT_877129 [Suillus ampliporus]
MSPSLMSPSPMLPPAEGAEGAEGHYNITPTTLLSLVPELLSNTDVLLDLLKEGISAQYATCEKYRNHMVTTLWRLEEAKRWSRFLQHTLIVLRKDHQAAQSGLRIWVELAEKHITEASSSSDATAPHETLKLVQMDYNTLEGLAIACGLTDEDFNLGLDLLDEDLVPDEDMPMKDDKEESGIDIVFHAYIIYPRAMDVSKKRCPTHQNAANIPKPGKHSGLNPSLQPAEGQLNRAVERTDTPMAYDDLLRSLDEASDSEMNNKYEGEVELEDGPSNPYFGWPVPNDQYSGRYAPQYYPPQRLSGPDENEAGPSNQYYPPQRLSGPDEDKAGLSDQYSGWYTPQYYLPQCLSGLDEDKAGPSNQYSGNQYYPPQRLSVLPLQQPGPGDQYYHQPQDSIPPQLQTYEQPLQHYQALPHYQLPQHHEQQPMHFDNLPSSSPPPSMFNSTTDNYCQEDTPSDRYNYLPLHSFGDLTPPHIRDLQRSTASTLRTGVIRAAGETSVTALVPSQRQLPPPYRPSSPMSPASGSEVAHPAPQPQLTNTELKEMMKEAKLIMRRMVLLENAMPLTAQNGEMVEKALLEAAARVASITSLSQIPNHGICCKTLTTITTTVCSVFKNEARSVLPDHYSLTPDSITDVALLMEHRQSIVAPLLLNQAYLFTDPSTVSLVNHPAIIKTIYRSVWGTSLHEVLNLDKLDDLNNLYSLGGAAVHNGILEYEGGARKTIQFSPSSLSGKEYKEIQQHNIFVCNTPALHSTLQSITRHTIAQGVSLYGR